MKIQLHLLVLVFLLSVRLCASSQSAGSSNTTEEKSASSSASQSSDSAQKINSTSPATINTNQEKSASSSPTPSASSSSKTETKKEVEEKNIYLNFENTSLNNLVNYMAELKKINLIPHKDLESKKISLTTTEPISITTAWNMFLTILETAEFTIVLPENSNVHRIVPKDKNIKEPLPFYWNVALDELPDSDILIRYVAQLNNIQSTDVADLLKSFLNNPPAEQQLINGFVITDKSYTIKAAMRVIQELDQTGLKEDVSVITLKKANATEVKELLLDLSGAKDTAAHPLARMLGKQAENNISYFSASTKIIAEPRSNKLILLGTQKSIDAIIAFITNHLDTDLKEVDSPVHIYELQYADATQIKEILEKVVNEIPDESKIKGGVRDGVKCFKQMKFNVDKDGNRLIVSTPEKQDWKLLKKTINDLDKAQPQVAIETLIVSVDIIDTKELGGSIRNKKNGSIGKDINFQAAPLGNIQINAAGPGPTNILGNLLNNLGGGLGSAACTFGAGTNIWAVFQALRKQTNSSIISNPFITIANRVAGTIKIGEERLIESQTVGSGPNPTVGRTPKEKSTTIIYTPQINLDGLISLNIDATIADFVGDAGNSLEKTLKTYITVSNGQVLVLGGFIKTKINEITGSTPVLSKIPILGWFFKNKERTSTKSYIFLFICPTIVKPRQTPGIELYTKMKLHKAVDDIEACSETKKTNDPLFNWFFDPTKETYSHKVVDYANARYQPTTVDIQDDPFYRSASKQELALIEKREKKIHQREPELKLDPAATDTPYSNRRPVQSPEKQPVELDKPIVGNKSVPRDIQKATQQNKEEKTAISTPQVAVTDDDKELKKRRSLLKDLLMDKGLMVKQDKPNTPIT